MDKDYRRFLIVRTDRIGDVILTLPMARVLKRRRPDAVVAMLLDSYTAELAEADPDVDEVITVSGRSPSLFQTVSDLRRRRFDVVFHTHPRPRLALMTALAGIPVRVGTGYRWYSFLFNRRVYEHRKDARRHELEYNLHLLRAVGVDEPWGDIRPAIALDEAHRAAAREILADAGIPAGSKLAILHPGSGGSARDWSPGKFSELAALLAAHDGVSVLLTGGRGETDLVERVRSGCPAGVKAARPASGIRDYAALASLASVFVANSTGPLHIASAVGTPVVGLYPQITPLSAARWGPYTDRKIVLTPVGFPADCSRCAGGRSECECMESIAPAAVHDAAMKLLRAEAHAA